MSKLVIATVILFGTFVLAGAAEAKELYKATLSGTQEVPLVVTNTSGRAFFRVNNARTKIEFVLHLKNAQGITQAHIHCAPAGANGAVVAFLADWIHAGG